MKRRMGVGLSAELRGLPSHGLGDSAVNKLVKSEHGDCDEVKAPAPVCSYRRSPSFTHPPALSVQIGRAPPG